MSIVEKGANVNARDDIWYQTPLSSAVGVKKEYVRLFLKSGAKDFDAALLTAVSLGNSALTEIVLEQSKPSQDALDGALYAISSGSNQKLKDMLTKAGAKPLPKASEEDRKKWAKFAGTYDSDGGQKLPVSVKDVGLLVAGRYVKPVGPDTFSPLGSEGSSFRFELANGEVSRIVMKKLTAEYSFYRFKPPVAKPVAPATVASKRMGPPLNWPSFRGPDGTGVADSQNPPVVWNGAKGESIRWKTPIPGLGHSCPVVWGDRVFLTTAISSGQADPKIRIGNYGDVQSVNDTSKHTWQVLCLDRDTGKILWTKTAYEGVPKIKRHLKGSQANCTPATDGKHLVVCFGSEGLYCYDFEGRLLWKRDLSTLDSSFALDVEYEWGFGNSPVLFEDKCILQCDLSRDSFIAAFSLENGSKLWSTPRDEIPSWSSPVVWKKRHAPNRHQRGSICRGYDPASGAELWRLAKKSEVTIPTPVLGKDLAMSAAATGRSSRLSPSAPERPATSRFRARRKPTDRSPGAACAAARMPTPILYGEYLYTCSNSGVVTCYKAATGRRFTREHWRSQLYRPARGWRWAALSYRNRASSRGEGWSGVQTSQCQ